MKNSLRILLIVAMATVTGAVIVPAAHAANLGTQISRGETMRKGDYLHRSIHNYAVELIMQRDGNLVLKATTGRVCWAANTVGGDHAAYQRDGNFVVYNSSGRALWASNTVDGGSGESGQTVSLNAGGTLYAGYRRISTCSP